MGAWMDTFLHFQSFQWNQIDVPMAALVYIEVLTCLWMQNQIPIY